MTEQEQREQIISNLQILHTWCAVNPDYGRGLSVDDCKKAAGWLDEALVLLKAQGPRIMSLAEAKNADSVWLEDIDKEAVVPAKCFGSIDHADEHRRTGFMARYGRCTFKSICPRDDDYMVRWRAWTAEPSSAQREATPWQK